MRREKAPDNFSKCRKDEIREEYASQPKLRKLPERWW